MAVSWRCACGASGVEDVRQCPACGSEALSKFLGFEERLSLSDYGAGLIEDAGKPAGFFETERDGRTSSASSDEAGISFTIAGSAPQGEEDTLTACRILVSCLNALGAHWTAPEPGGGVADATSVDQTTGATLTIQVVRAVTDPTLWKQLNRTGSVSGSGRPVAEIVEHLHRAIEHKCDQLPSTSRRGVVLALDATRFAAAGLDDVVETFIHEEGEWAAAQGFDAIWVVGPHHKLTRRLAGPPG